ncbi:17843_t:CDS:10, partial [Acaulospora morrowiae]
LMSFKNPESLKDRKKTKLAKNDSSLKFVGDDKDKSPHINITIDSDEEVTPPVAIEVHLSDSDAASLSDIDLTDDEQSVSHRRKAAKRLSKRLSVSYTGEFNIDAYYIDSMFTPLLFSIIQFITIEDSSLGTLLQMHKTLGLMIQQKPDLYLDIIEIIAHGDPTSRKLATCILFSFWGNSIGLPVIGEDLLGVRYLDCLRAYENLKGQDGAKSQQSQNAHDHQLFPHIFSDDYSQNSDKFSLDFLDNKKVQPSPTDVPNACFQCFKPVVGFCLRCNICKLSLHFGCYNSDESGFLTEYSSESGVHKLSTPRYCNIICGAREPDFINNHIADYRAAIISEHVSGHTFHLINLFTLTLCMVCRLPLWGVMYQGYRCETCNRFIHPYCLKSKTLETDTHCHQSVLSESDALIDHESLRESFKDYYGQIVLSGEVISTYNYEELSVMATIFQMQNNILNNGLLAGCLIIKPKLTNPLSMTNEKFEKFELQEAITIYESYLESGKVYLTPTSNEYWEGTNRKYDLWLISSEDYLAHLAAVIKSGNESEFAETDRTDFHLSVNMLGANLASTADNNVFPDGILTTKEIIRWMKKKMGFHNDFSVKVFLQQMANYGFLERVDGHPILFNGVNSEESDGHECFFPLPFATECSPTVETLLATISVCLSDINISINECGFLLMTRRCWPDPYLSKYVLERLIYSVIEWICDDDEKLLTVAKEYTALHLKPPGVHHEMEEKRSDLGHSSQRSSHVPNTAGGGAYIVSRQMLNEKYLFGWMSKIHHMDRELFCDIVYEQIERVYENKRKHEKSDGDSEDVFRDYDNILKLIVKLCNSGLLFTSCNDIISRWLDNACFVLRHQPKVFVELRTLYKMFSPLGSSIRRTSSLEQSTAFPENNKIEVIDPIEIITQTFEENDNAQLMRALQWIDLIVRSSVGFRGSVFADFLSSLKKHTPSLEQYATFLQIMWHQVIIGLGHLITRGVILELVSDINETAFDAIKKINEEGYGAEISSVPKRISNIPDPTQGANVTVEASLMQYLLEYARCEKLEVRSDVVKTSWLLFTEAGLIFNKNEFIINSVPKLLPSVWEELSPIYDFSSNITMPLLIRMIWADSRFFLASVSKVFEHQSWEVRFDGLDKLFSLFSKLDERFNIQRAGVFSYLGPVFSYFVCCLWDHEEYVRTKAISYIRAMRSQQLRLAFKCWEGYFMVANNREKTLLCRFMLKLNAKFPKWQVIEWGILLDALNQEDNGAETVTTTEILESYVRPDSILVIGLKNLQDESFNLTPGQRAAEEQNLKVIMLTLALQMLANGIDIKQDHLFIMKYLVVKNLGFADCKLELINGSNNLSYGELKYSPEDFTQNMMMVSCLGNLKRVLDTPIYLRSTDVVSEDAVVLSEGEDELLGGFFVDVVFALFNSSVDMSKLSHITLKMWIELLLIIVYKHKIEDRNNKGLEEGLINAMRQISDLLLKDITEENKQLSIELATSLLKRAPMLTVNILGKQIITLGKLLTKLPNDTNNSLVMSGKTFLRAAFLKFARNGLFVLIFKNQIVADENQAELDMFRVLRDVIHDQQIPVEDESLEPSYLRDEPIRDVFNQLFKFTNRKIVSTILFNLSKYVELVYSKPYSEQLMGELSQFLIKLTKHTSEWKEVDWDVNPVLNMISVIMNDNPTNAAVFVIPSLFIFATSARRHYHIIEQRIFDSATSISSDLNLLFSIDRTHQPYFSNVIEYLFDDCMNFLESPPVSKTYSRKEFKVGVCSCQVAVAMCNQDYDLLKKIFLWQKPIDTRRTIRLFNWILLGILTTNSSTNLMTTVFNFQDNVSDLLLLALKQPFNDVVGESDYLHTPSGELIYQSFILIKIWTTLCSFISKQQTKTSSQSPSGRDQDKGKMVGAPRVHQKLSATLSTAERRFWNSIWPSIKKPLVGIIFEKELQANGAVYWEMFIDLITYLNLCGSDIVMLYSQEWTTLLDSISKEDFTISASSEFLQRINQARTMFNDPPLMMQDDMLITQLYLEMREDMTLYCEINSGGTGKIFGSYI